MRLLIGLVARALFWVGLGVIVIDAVVELWNRGDGALAVAAAIFFPVTFIVWPWTHEAFGYPLWIVLVAAVIAYPISTFVGGLEPVG